MNGPGNFGSWSTRKDNEKHNLTSKKVTDLKRFCEDIKDGDIVVLRRGSSEVYGVGIIKGEYEWSDNFRDIDGWELQHIRRVEWKWSSLESPKKFPLYTLKLGDTTQSCDAPEVITWVKKIIKTT